MSIIHTIRAAVLILTRVYNINHYIIWEIPNKFFVLVALSYNGKHQLHNQKRSTKPFPNENAEPITKDMKISRGL